MSQEVRREVEEALPAGDGKFAGSVLTYVSNLHIGLQQPTQY